MSVSDKINEFIIIVKKLMVLKKVELSNTEPRVSVVYLPSGEIIYTFISSLFPFFTHRSFETVKEGEIDMLLKKCSDYLKNYESNYTIGETEEVKNPLKNTGYDIFISKNGEISRFNLVRQVYYKNGENHSHCKVREEKINLWEKSMYLLV